MNSLSRKPRVNSVATIWFLSFTTCSFHIHGNCFVVAKTLLPKRWLLSSLGSTVDCVTSGMRLPKRCLANGHIPSQYFVFSETEVTSYVKFSVTKLIVFKLELALSTSHSSYIFLLQTKPCDRVTTV
jgi:hypothetical protein